MNMNHPILRQMKQTIDLHGVAIQVVFGCEEGESSMAYTVGLERNYGHPELLIVCDTGPHVSGAILNIAHDLIREASRSNNKEAVLRMGTRDDRFLHDMDVVFKPVENFEQARKYVTIADIFAMNDVGRPARVIQAVLPDSDNKMPWDEGYNAEQMRSQKLLFTIAPAAPAPTRTVSLAKFLAAVEADNEADTLNTIEVSITETVTETFTVYVDVPRGFDHKDPANYEQLAEWVEKARIGQGGEADRQISVNDVDWHVKKGRGVEDQDA